MSVLMSCFRCSKPLLVAEETLSSGQTPYCSNCREALGLTNSAATSSKRSSSNVQTKKQPANRAKSSTYKIQEADYGDEPAAPMLRPGLIVLVLCAIAGVGAAVLLTGVVVMIILTSPAAPATEVATPSASVPATKAVPRGPAVVEIQPVAPVPEVKVEPAEANKVPSKLVIQASTTTGVFGVAFSPDGTVLGTASGHLEARGEIRFWKVATGQPSVLPVAPGSDLFGIAFRPDGSMVAAASGSKGIQLYNPQGLFLAGYSHPGYVRSVAFSPNGACLASSCDRQLKVWNLTTGKELWSVSLLNNLQTFRVPTRISFSPDGKRLAAGNGGANVLVYNAATGRVLTTCTGHTGLVVATAYAPNGKYLASGSSDETIRIWDAAKGQALNVLTGHDGGVLCVAFASDGRTLASAGRDEKVILWDVPTGRKLATLTGHKKDVCCVTFSPDGNTLASSGLDGTVRLWDVSRVVSAE